MIIYPLSHFFSSFSLRCCLSSLLDSPLSLLRFSFLFPFPRGERERDLERDRLSDSDDSYLCLEWGKIIWLNTISCPTSQYKGGVRIVDCIHSNPVSQSNPKIWWALIRNTVVFSLCPCPCPFFSLLGSLNDFETLFSIFLFSLPRLWAFSTIKSYSTLITLVVRGMGVAKCPVQKMGGAGSLRAYHIFTPRLIPLQFAA